MTKPTWLTVTPATAPDMAGIPVAGRHGFDGAGAHAAAAEARAVAPQPGIEQVVHRGAEHRIASR